MTWTAPMTGTAGMEITAAIWNEQIRDNMSETAPALATTAGAYFTVDGPNQISERIPATDSVGTAESTSSTSYTNLATHGPSVTVETGVAAKVTISARMHNSSGTGVGAMGCEVSGASTVTPTTARALRTAATSFERSSYTYLQTGLTPGMNTFTAKYVSGGSSTMTFANRDILVEPM